jgi:hypothetical protein
MRPGPNLAVLVNSIEDYHNEAPRNFAYGGDEGKGEEGYEIKFSAHKREFIEGFTEKIGSAVVASYRKRFSNAGVASDLDIYDARHYPQLPDNASRQQKDAYAAAITAYGTEEIVRIGQRLAGLSFEASDGSIVTLDPAELESEWLVFRALIGKRPSSESSKVRYTLEFRLSD